MSELANCTNILNFPDLGREALNRIDSFCLFRYYICVPSWAHDMELTHRRFRKERDCKMKVSIIMGSDSDWPILKSAYEMLKKFDVEAEVHVASAHRTPARVKEIVETAQERGVGAFISAAGAAAHLGGVIASYTTLPVIGVPINATSLNGMDALLSTVQMPSGIPVATMAVNGAKNAAIFVLEMFAISDPELAKKLADYRRDMVEEVTKKDARIQQQLG